MTSAEPIAEQFRLGAFAGAGRPQQDQTIGAIARRCRRIAGEIRSANPSFSIRRTAHRLYPRRSFAVKRIGWFRESRSDRPTGTENIGELIGLDHRVSLPASPGWYHGVRD